LPSSVPPAPSLAPATFSTRLRPPPRPTLFPYTTLFRSHGSGQATGPHATDGGRNLQLQRTRLPGGGDLPLRDGHPGEEREVSTSDRKSTRLNSSHVAISYAVFCLKKKS